MKIFIHTFLLLTFFAFTANLVQKVIWTEKTETVSKSDDPEDDSDDSDEDDETEKKETEWFSIAYSLDTVDQESFKENTSIQFPEVTNKLPDAVTSILKSPPDSMC